MGDKNDYSGMKECFGVRKIFCVLTGNYMSIHICQDYQNCIPKKAEFSVFNIPVNLNSSPFPTSEQQGQDFFSKTPIKSYERS